MSQMNQKSKVLNVALLAIWCFSVLANISLAVSPEELQKIEDAAPTRATVTPQQPRMLLVFNLCKGFKHSSIPYWDKALEIMGRKTGAYVTVISNDMSMFEPENLKQFDAVCLNNTTKLDFKDPQLRESLMDFIKGGKGIVGIHAATDNFYDWPEAAEIMGGQFAGHPWRANGTWAIKIDEPEHPLTAVFGGKGFKINDELYRTEPPLYSRVKQRVLLSLDMSDEATRSVKGLKPDDMDTGISWVKSCGKGRLFYCSLGHNHHITWNPAILRHYLDGIQFALGDLPVDITPCPKMQLDELLSKIATYEYGQSRQLLTELDDLVRSTYDSPQALKRIEKRFLQFLVSDATPAAKQFICRKLSIIGTEESVPTLTAMLTAKATSQIEPSDMARYALERIPGPAVDKALRDALGKTSGEVKVGIINSLGQRGDEEAVEQLGKLLSSTDKDIAQAALSALGKIGGRKAAKLLSKAGSEVGPQLQLAWADACLMCADKLLAAGDKRSAVRIYRQMYAPRMPWPMRAAGLRGIVTVRPDRAVKLVVGALKGEDEQMQAVAVGLLREIAGAEMIEAVTAELPNLSVTGQVRVLSALGDRGGRSALPAVISATKSAEADVRVAAFGALGGLGDASSVDLLAQAAATAKGAEQEAARQGLYRLRGLEADEKILASIPQADSKVKVELIRSIGERNMVTAVETLLKTAQARQAEVRLESLKVLKVIADQTHLPALLDLLISSRSEAERTEAENTVAAVAREISDKDRRADSILAVLPSVERQLEARCSMLRVLGKIGGSDALGVLQKALEDRNGQVQVTAVRALSDWPSPEPIDSLWKVAKDSENEIQRVLALRGFVRLIGLSDRPAGEKTKMYQEAMELASNVSEKKMVLSGLANVKSFTALQMAADYLDDRLLRQEAEAAVVRITAAVHTSFPAQSKAVLEQVLQICENDSLRRKAQELIERIKKIEEEKIKASDVAEAGAKIQLIGDDFSAWREDTGDWQIVGEAIKSAANEELIAIKPGTGVIVNGPKGRTVALFSKTEFGDVQAHIEFMVPRKSNSGVYFMGRYEIQILDSWGVEEPKYSDCGGIYQRWDENRSPKGYEGRPPRVNASLPPGQWQTYDCLFRAPRFDESGKKIANARFEKVVHNGVVVHENVEVTGPTRAGAYKDEKPTGPLMLQGDHGPVAYRNIWIVPLKVD